MCRRKEKPPSSPADTSSFRGASASVCYDDRLKAVCLFCKFPFDVIFLESYNAHTHTHTYIHTYIHTEEGNPLSGVLVSYQCCCWLTPLGAPLRHTHKTTTVQLTWLKLHAVDQWFHLTVTFSPLWCHREKQKKLFCKELHLKSDLFPVSLKSPPHWLTYWWMCVCVCVRVCVRLCVCVSCSYLNMFTFSSQAENALQYWQPSYTALESILTLQLRLNKTCRSWCYNTPHYFLFFFYFLRGTFNKFMRSALERTSWQCWFPLSLQTDK